MRLEFDTNDPLWLEDYSGMMVGFDKVSIDTLCVNRDAFLVPAVAKVFAKMSHELANAVKEDASGSFTAYGYIHPDTLTWMTVDKYDGDRARVVMEADARHCQLLPEFAQDAIKQLLEHCNCL